MKNLHSFCFSSKSIKFGALLFSVTMLFLIGAVQPTLAATSLSNNTLSASNVCAGSVKVPVLSFSLTQTTSNVNFTSLVFTTGGTYVVADLVKFQLWTNTANALASATQVGSDLTTSMGTGSHTFSGFTQALTSGGGARYFWITIDVSASLAVSHTLTTSNISSTAITVSTGSVSGSANAGGTQTLYPPIASNTISADQSLCAGASASALTGSTPTGGTGTYTYLWESSTTSAAVGFATATGTSNAKNYTPSSLSATTWFRRTVTSGGCSSISSTVQVTINPLPGAITISGSGNVCTGTTLLATGGVGGTIYYQGTISGGTSTANSSASQLISASGTYYFVAQSSAGCWGTQSSATVAIINPPTTTGVTVCQGSSGSISASATCLTISGNTSGPNNAGSAVENAAIGTSSWSNPGNITTAGTPYATTTIAISSTSRYLQASNYGFSIPASATINGISVSINRQSSSSTNLRDNIVSLLKGGVIQSTNRAATGSNWSTTMTLASYGSPSDLWGSAWLPADINASNFGVVLSASNLSSGGTRTATIDYIQITVTYTENGQIKWYTSAAGGSAIGSLSPFNPIGVSGSGLANTNTAGTTAYYAECSTFPGCRAAANFTIENNLAITQQPIAPSAICSGAGVQTISVGAIGNGLNYTWRKDGVALTNGGVVSGQGTSILTLTNPIISDDGNYDVIVSASSCGSQVTSSAVSVVINAAPAIVVQPLAPTATCPGSGVQMISVQATGAGLTYSWRKDGTVVSNSSVLSGQGTNTITLTAPANSDAGIYDVVITGVCSPSVISNSVNVVVEDVDAPIITNCPSDIHIATSGSCTAIATWALPVASDNCIVTSFNSDYTSGSDFPVGTTTVTYTATDGSSNLSTCSFDVIVEDNEFPVMSSCPADLNVTYSIVTWTPPTVSDNCSATLTSNYQPGSTFPIGTTNVEYLATDPSGNTVICSFNVTVHSPSTPPSSISSSIGQEICSGSSTTLSQVGGVLSSGAQWVWYVDSCGGIPVGNGAVLTIAPTSTTSYFVRAEDGSYSSACASLTILVSHSQPDTVTAILGGIANACSGSTGVFTINPVSGASAYTWSITSGSMINGMTGYVSVADTFVNVSFGSLPGTGISGYNLCVSASNACGFSTNKCAWIRGALSTPVYTSAPVVVCTGVATTYSINPMTGASNYNWVATGGATISGNGNPTVNIIFPVGYVSGTISVSAQLPCGNSSPIRSLAVATAPALPGSIIGQTIVCPSSTMTYSINPVAGASSYTWTVPAGCTFAGAGTSISVTFSSTFVAGTVCVTAVSSCGTNSPLRCRSVSTGKLPTPGNITGDPTAGVCGQLYQYSIPSLANATLGYTWTIPAGVSIVGNASSNSITLQFPANFISGVISVHGNNSCGAGYDRSITVYGNPSTPGIISGNTTVCPGSLELYTWAPVPGATEYQVFAPAGSQIVSGAITSGTYALIQWGSVGGNISLKAVNGCGVSGTRVLAATIGCRMNNPYRKIVREVIAYPNPSHGVFRINVESEIDEVDVISVFDQTGLLRKQMKVEMKSGVNILQIDMNGIAAGVYVLRVESASGETLNKIIIIE